MPFLKAAVQFWDPSYKGFSFNKKDLTPTIEEYSILLGINLQYPDKMYNRASKITLVSKLFKIIKKSGDANFSTVQKGRWECILWGLLRSYILKHLDDDSGIDAYALAIYGLIVFPVVLGHIEKHVVDLVEQIKNQKVNPVPAILAETFRSLNFCRQNGDARFIGCGPLLYIWLRSHLGCGKGVFTKPFRNDALPIQEFCQVEWPILDSREEWVYQFANLTDEQVNWMAPWMPGAPVLYRCGNEEWVPLLGP